MTESNRPWSVLCIALLVATALVPTAATAISATANDAPETAQVGENVSATFTLSDLYTKAPTAWRLHGTTELKSATWTVTGYGLDGSQLTTRSFDGRSFRTPVRASQNVSRLEITVTGTVPKIENFTYPAKERFTLATLARTHKQTPRTRIKNWSVHHYTAASRSARRKLNASHHAVTEDDGNGELEEQVEFAVSAYRHGNFDLATAIADDAKDAAEQPDYPVGLLSGLFLGGIVVALGSAGLRSYRTRTHEDDPWRDR
ncbi:MAG TPA: hypothetical protein VFJ06_01095 [Halococcus sp.]|nr:hypothetical protein [Halococcus sp.]